MHKWKKKRATIAQQHLALSIDPISGGGEGKLSLNYLEWTFKAKPTPLSRDYTIKVKYRFGSHPKVYVISPDLLELANGKKLPHVYSQDPVALCLYLPKSGEWSSYKFISDTIISWSILWLFYFEDWLSTGEWRGGGKHPEVNNEKQKKNSFNRRRRNQRRCSSRISQRNRKRNQ